MIHLSFVELYLFYLFSSLGKVITNPDPSGIFTEFYTDMSSPSKALKHVGESGTLMYIFKLKVKLL